MSSPGPAPALPRRAADDVGGRARAPVLPGAGALGILFVGLALGLAATGIVLGRGWDPGALAIGPWVTRPKVGTAAIDPYAGAELARTGAVPLAASEGLSFTATTDDTGYRLLRTCSYRLSGDVPPARFWTLTASDRAGLTLADPARRTAFTSMGVVRDETGRLEVEVGPEARPGNWLMLSGDGPLTLTLRLYDTPLAGNAGEIAGASLPNIARQTCGGAKR